jgi:hypothetical protein
MHISNFNKNFIQSNYLSKYDLINKYNLKNIYDCPFLKKVIINISLKNLFSIKESQSNNYEIKSFLFFLLLFSVTPFINFKHIDTKKTLEFVNGEYCLKIVLLNNEELNCFLFFLFYENYNNEKISSFFKFNNEKSVINKKLINTQYIANLPLKNLTSITKIFEEVLLNVNVNESLLNINFIVNNSYHSEKKTNIIKNLPCFWING